MILDHLSQWRRYAALEARFERGFRYLETVTPQTPLGRYELAGSDLFVLVQTYPAKPVEQCRFEAHRQYADIQFIVAGTETILWAPLTALTTVTEAYNPEKDIAFFGRPANATALSMVAGQFAVFFPADGHAPGGGTGTVLKAVVKVRL
jgi:YhcH/YjgK/YiaL family protein